MRPLTYPERVPNAWGFCGEWHAMRIRRVLVLIDGGFFLKRLPKVVERNFCNSKVVSHDPAHPAPPSRPASGPRVAPHELDRLAAIGMVPISRYLTVCREPFSRALSAVGRECVPSDRRAAAETAWQPLERQRRQRDPFPEVIPQEPAPGRLPSLEGTAHRRCVNNQFGMHQVEGYPMTKGIPMLVIVVRATAALRRAIQPHRPSAHPDQCFQVRTH